MQPRILIIILHLINSWTGQNASFIHKRKMEKQRSTLLSFNIKCATRAQPKFLCYRRRKEHHSRKNNNSGNNLVAKITKVGTTKSTRKILALLHKDSKKPPGEANNENRARPRIHARTIEQEMLVAAIEYCKVAAKSEDARNGHTHPCKKKRQRISREHHRGTTLEGQ